jgi:4-aminobutyrate aminotransferase-like enzyme/Ser/Thr protein kinase RdoA (MazF antagonist)
MFDAAAQRPHFSIEDAQHFARDHFGRHPSIARQLPSDRDQNFYLEEPSGRSFVLKIAGAAEEEKVLDFQNQVLLHLCRGASRADSGEVPKTPATMSAPTTPALFPHPLAARDSQLVTRINENGRSFFVRLLTYLPGVPLVDVKPHTPELLAKAGRFLAQMDTALLDFSHPAMKRDLHWDLQRAAHTIGRYAHHITSPQKRALVELFLARFKQNVEPHLPALRHSIIQGDGNDHNLLISPRKKALRQVVGLIDFGDMVYSCTIFEAAIAAAYVMLYKSDPVAAAAQLISGYHAVLPLTEQELEMLPTLIAIRLCISVSLSAYQQSQEPDNRYLSISERPAWDLLRRLAEIPPQLIHYNLRHACGLTPYPGEKRLTSWLQKNRVQAAQMLPIDLSTANALVFDWSVGSLEMGSPVDFGDAQKETERLFARLSAAGTAVGVGRYDEARLVYTGDAFKTDDDERRTIHIGLDLFMPAGTPLYAPLDGTVHSFQDNAALFDYGPTIILQHQPTAELTFYTLYGHLSRDSLDGMRVGMVVKQGQEIGLMGDIPVNGGWPPHVHFQIVGDLLGREGEFPGVAPSSQREVWLSLCPDPNLLLGIRANCFPPPPLPKSAILSSREEHLGPSLSISYQKPLEIVRGWRQYLYDENGRAYLDVVNNVCHVGHSHPHVVKALTRQAAVLNTNTRYLHPNIVRYAERLLATLPEPLEVCFFVCSGSEANELALRLARTYTGVNDMIVVDGAYHGNTAALIDISPYKHDGPGGSGAPSHVHTVLMPDPYRGKYKGYGLKSGAHYARYVQDAVAGVKEQGRSVAAFICESLLGCGGQIVLPDGYLQAAFRHVRAAGAVCIADEVQIGFGRIGTHFWGFESQGVVPDIVTMGKPMGNGHPLAAVITTRAIADAFANGMEYFNTFGGNPVSCAVGSAVLDVIEEEGLQENALRTGARLLEGLVGLMDRHPLKATYIVERMKEHGILLSIDGPLHNVLKLKPPIVFNEENADFLISTLDIILAEDAAQPRE